MVPTPTISRASSNSRISGSSGPVGCLGPVTTRAERAPPTSSTMPELMPLQRRQFLDSGVRLLAVVKPRGEDASDRALRVVHGGRLSAVGKRAGGCPGPVQPCIGSTTLPSGSRKKQTSRPGITSPQSMTGSMSTPAVQLGGLRRDVVDLDAHVLEADLALAAACRARGYGPEELHPHLAQRRHDELAGPAGVEDAHPAEAEVPRVETLLRDPVPAVEAHVCCTVLAIGAAFRLAR